MTSIIEGIYQDIHDHLSAYDKIIAIAANRHTVAMVSYESRYELMQVSYKSDLAFQFMGYPVVFIEEIPDGEWITVCAENYHTPFIRWDSVLSYSKILEWLEQHEKVEL